MALSVHSPAYTVLAVLVAGLLSINALPLPDRSLADWINGKAMRDMERAIDTGNDFYKASLNLWSWLEFKLFGQGMQGVIRQPDGILYTADEFAWDRNSLAHYEANKQFIRNAAQELRTNNIELLIALVPAKARLAGLLPVYKRQAYDDFRSWASDQGIAVCDVSSSLSLDSFQKTDTHWTPQGSLHVAQAIATCLSHNTPAAEPPHATPIVHKGDLMAYLPFLARTESLSPYAYPTQGNVSAADLFGERASDTVLVGTSYSANPAWQFHPALEYALKENVLNMAKEGLGPYAAMRDFLSHDTLNKSKRVIWEIPERYLTLETAP